MTLTAWYDHLAGLGYDPAADEPTLPDPLPASGCCDLGSQALLTVDGAEAETFLQGQLTCDVRRLANGDLLPAAHLTPKGRAVASFLAWRVDDTFHLQLPQALAEAMTRRLRMFLLRSKATVGRADETLVRLGAWGAAAAEVAAALVGTVPESAFRQSSRGGCSVLRLPGAEPRLELLLPVATAIEAWTALTAAGAEVCQEAAWRLLDIRAGLGWVRAETSEALLPQMLNYDRLGGVSFGKGCYVGQEVVARLHHLGEVKRRAYPGTVSAAEVPAPGTPLFSPGSTSRQGAGTVVDAIATGAQACELLAVVERKTLAADGLRLGAADGPEVVLHAPPYPLDDPAATGAGSRGRP
jgi:hypothetical protein